MTKFSTIKLGTKQEMSGGSGKYDVFATQGQGGSIAASFTSIRAALRYIARNWGQASYVIRYPKGSWYEWKGLCPICGEHIQITKMSLNSTLVIGSCGDSFLLHQWAN